MVGRSTLPVALSLAVAAVSVSAQSITTTAGPSIKSSTTNLRLAKRYMGSSFFDGFDFETADDPTGGYVNYVSQSYAQSEGLISVESNGHIRIRANSDTRASGRGRDSVRLASKDAYADGVYILDLNHMPVGCGTWPAWWTTVKDGWPRGGEIDIIEGANTLPTPFGTAWNRTAEAGTIGTPATKMNRNVASLHTNDMCYAEQNTYMTGTLELNTCSALVNGNAGCGAMMGGNTTFGVESFGQQVNNVGGGWYALWRDFSGSGGAYVWFWPRNSPNVPEDVRNPDTAATNVQNWGEPSANLTAPGCKQDFFNHVIVFNIAFCGDYSAATYGDSGCPAVSSCSAFVMNNPTAFTEAYWDINSMRVYNAEGKPAASGSSGLTGAQIGGIVAGVVGFLIIVGLLFWRYRVTKKRRLALAQTSEEESDPNVHKTYLGWAAADDGPSSLPTKVHKVAPLLGKHRRTGPTTLAPGKTARNKLDGETPANFYHDVADDLDFTPRGSVGAIPLEELPVQGTTTPTRGSTTRSSLANIGTRAPLPPTSNAMQPTAAAGRPAGRYSVAQAGSGNSAFAQVASGRRESTFAGDGNKGWVG